MDNKYKKILLAIIMFAAILRFWKLGSNPLALYWDEASLGYNAYSILKTARDEHGELMPLSRFIAFGDYKPSGYIYASVPFIALFGLNEFSIRFTSALTGTLTVLAIYLLVLELFGDQEKKWKHKLALISALLLAISPWHLQFSRGAFEANLATLFSTTGVLFFLKGLKKGRLLTLSAIFFVFSLYTFNTHRVFIPLLVILLAILYRKNIFKQKKWVLTASIVGLLLIIPLVPHLLTREGQLRFQEVTIFRNLDPINVAVERFERDGSSILARIVHNRRVQYTLEFAKHYFDHFSANFLFFSGDVNPRLGTQDNGLLYPIELPLIIIGIYILIRKFKIQSKTLLLWILIGIIPAATARETPHALRILNILPVPQIIAALGILTGFELIKKKQLYKIFIVSCYLLLVVNYLHTYHVHYPKQWAASWQYGYKQMVNYIAEIEDEYDKVFITKKYGRPYIYFLLYNKYPPEKYWQTRDAQRDWFGLWIVNGFDKYRFGNFDPIDSKGSEKWLLVAGPQGLPKEATHLKTIVFPNNETVFEIGEVK